jgi:hypothetical protein
MEPAAPRTPPQRDEDRDAKRLAVSPPTGTKRSESLEDEASKRARQEEVVLPEFPLADDRGAIPSQAVGVEDWLDTQITKVEEKEARIIEIQKLLSFSAFQPKPLKAARGHKFFPCKWVGTKKDGVVKQRLTIADTRWRSPHLDPV